MLHVKAEPSRSRRADQTSSATARSKGSSAIVNDIGQFLDEIQPSGAQSWTRRSRRRARARRPARHASVRQKTGLGERSPPGKLADCSSDERRCARSNRSRATRRWPAKRPQPFLPGDTSAARQDLNVERARIDRILGMRRNPGMITATVAGVRETSTSRRCRYRRSS